MKKIITLIAIVVLLTNSMSVNASSQTYYFTYEIGENNVGYWLNNDPAMPSSGSYFFYVKNGLVRYIPENKAIPLILNKGIGLTMKPEVLANFILNYLEHRVVASPIALVYKGTEKVGMTVEDLANLPVAGTTIGGGNDEEVTLPSSYVNNVYNYYEHWVEDNGYDLPDYINVETRNKQFYSNKFDNTNTRAQAYKNFIASNDYAIAQMSYNSNNLTYAPGNCWVGDINHVYFVPYGQSSYENYCNLHHLTNNDIVVNFVDQMLASNSIELYCKAVDNLQNVIRPSIVTYNTDGTYSLATKNTGFGNQPFFAAGSLGCAELQYITIYKNDSILNQFMNETYSPITFVNQDFTNFSTDNDNTVTTTITEIDNSSDVNETIYNETSESFTEYYTENNYHVDNSVTIENNTQIFNTYYGDSSGGGDNGGGDNGGGGEIIVPDYDFGYLKVITDILAEFLKGVQDLNEMIIDTIHSITLAFGGITTLYESVFGWLPDPILGLMIIGLGLALLGSFITWFR